MAKFEFRADNQRLIISGNVIKNTTGSHDNEWDDCSCSSYKNIQRKNLLGKALMELRTELSNAMLDIRIGMRLT